MTKSTALNVADTFLAVLLATNMISCSEDRKSPIREVSAEIDGVEVVIRYGSPKVNGREGKLWGGMLPYNEVWRAGANEATTINFSDNVLINDSLRLSEGTYALFIEPSEEEWKVIFNEEGDQWGTEYEFHKDQNVGYFTVIPNTIPLVEDLTYKIEGNNIVFQWEFKEIQLLVKGPK